MKKIFLSVLFIFIFNSAFSIELYKSPTKAALLSLLVPGGGQYYNKSYKKMIGFGSTELSLICLLIYHNHKMNYYYDKVMLENSNYNYNLEQYNNYYNNIQSDYWWIGSTILMSVLDSYVEAHLINFDEKKRKLNLKFRADKLELSYHF